MTTSLHALRQPNAPVEELAKQFGHKLVKDELFEMCYEDMADWALESAIRIGAHDIARTAAIIVWNSGSYSNDSKNSAAAYLAKAGIET